MSKIFIFQSEIIFFGEKFLLYYVSYLWYVHLGAFVSVIVSLVTSYVTHPVNPVDVDPSLLAPFLIKLIKRRNVDGFYPMNKLC
jgi:hypothetical protein